MMAKRFTETDKWVDAWFHALPLDQKVAYLFILDRCDWGGVYEHSQTLAESMIGGRVDFNALVENSGGRLTWLPGARTHIWVVKFIEFQVSLDKLNPKHKPHVPIFKSCDKYNLGELHPRLGRALAEALQRLQDKDKDTDTLTTEGSKRTGERSKARSGGYSADFETFWAAFPRGRKKSKGAAFKAWQKALATGVTVQALVGAASEYAASDAGRGEYVKMPSTWLNQRCWEDDRAAWSATTAEQPKSEADKWLERKLLEEQGDESPRDESDSWPSVFDVQPRRIGRDS